MTSNEIIKVELSKTNIVRYLLNRTKRTNMEMDHGAGELCFFEYPRRENLNCLFCSDFFETLNAVEIIISKKYHHSRFNKCLLAVRAAYPNGIDYIKTKHKNVSKKLFK